MVWMLFSVTASLTTHTLITRIVGVLPVTDCGQVEDPKMTKAYLASKEFRLSQVSRGEAISTRSLSTSGYIYSTVGDLFVLVC